MTGAELAQAAETLVGTPFRLHGRDSRIGLDCVGLVVAALALVGTRVAPPTGYTLRLARIEPWLPDPANWGLAPAHPPAIAGDLILLRPGPGQFHLAIAGTGGCWIHAHAGLRRVVREPCRPTGTVIHHWRPLPVP